MANPQRENGHVQIATDIQDALIRIRIPGQARQVFDFIVRKTWGWNKREDQIPLSQFVEATGMKKPRVIEARADLLNMNLIVVTQKCNDVATTYSIQKDYDKWKPLRKSVTLRKSVKVVTQKRNHTLRKSVPSIDNNTIDTVQQTHCEASPRVPQPHQEIVEHYKKIIGVDGIEGWDKVNFSRFAKDASNLLSMLGSVPEVKGAIDWINQESSGKYSWHLGTLAKNIHLYKNRGSKGEPMSDKLRQTLEMVAKAKKGTRYAPTTQL